MYGLLLGARGVYEVFCSKQASQFSVTDVQGNPLTSTVNVVKNKKQVIGAFFDIATIDDICQRHGLKFANR